MIRDWQRKALMFGVAWTSDDMLTGVFMDEKSIDAALIWLNENPTGTYEEWKESLRGTTAL